MEAALRHLETTYGGDTKKRTFSSKNTGSGKRLKPSQQGGGGEGSSKNKKDTEGGLYGGLPARIHGGDLESILELPRAGGRPQDYVSSLLREIVTPAVLSEEKAVDLIDSKVKNKVVLLDNPQKESFSIDKVKEKKAKQAASSRHRGLGRAGMKRGNALLLDAATVKYSDFITLHEVKLSSSCHSLCHLLSNDRLHAAAQ